MDLAGRTALVTGGGVRLGRAIALGLADAGCDVIVHCHSHTGRAEEVAGRIREKGRRAWAVRADLLDLQAATAAVFGVTDAGPVSVLVNNAAIFEPADLWEVDEDHWDRHLGLNAKAPFFLTRHFAGQLPDGEAGSVVNILCRRATRPTAEDLPYTAAKAGLLALTKGLALKLAPSIRVNGVAPGAMLPPAGRCEDEAAWEAKKAPKVPLRRVGGADPVVDAVLYLCRADFVTGEVIHTAGGEQL